MRFLWRAFGVSKGIWVWGHKTGLMLNRYLLALVLMVVMGVGSLLVAFSRFGVNRWTVVLLVAWVSLVGGYVFLGSRFQPEWLREEKRRRLEDRDRRR